LSNEVSYHSEGRKITSLASRLGSQTIRVQSGFLGETFISFIVSTDTLKELKGENAGRAFPLHNKAGVFD